ncbi:helix-turn-helix transcriptional regulator [Actinoplanes sp. CA-142083]|uniref:helix-turn-helix transcriptional regulator n=1 Tax=Actinoplanes sp. CA-142083 TaxID=3239903 RepID=UPI003D8BDD7E
MQLFGRDDELRTVLETVRAGGSLLIAGDPGIGKSALLDAAAEHGHDDGRRVLRAAGVEFEADISFAGLNQLLMPLVRERAPADPAPVDPVPRDHAPVEPALRGRTPVDPALRVALGLADGPAPSFLALANAILAELAGAAPVLLVVDDLPWLDRSSAIVLGMVARRLSGLRAALIGGQRTGDTGFFEHGGLPRVTLRPLDDRAGDSLLRTRFPRLTPRARQRVLGEAQGNPLALTELPAGRLSGPGPAGSFSKPGPAGSVSGPAPAGLFSGAVPAELSGASAAAYLPMSRKLQDVFAARIDDLPAASRELLLLAALSGPADLRSVAGGDLAGLDPALREGIVMVDPRSGRLGFRHPLSRLAVVELATPGERHRAHRQLADRAPDPVRRAFHLAESTVEPDEQVAGILERAAHIVLARGDAVAGVETLTRAAELSADHDARLRRLAQAATIGAEVVGELGSAEELVRTAGLPSSTERSAGPPGAPGLSTGSSSSLELSAGPPSSLELSTAAASVLFNRDSVVDTPHRLLTLALRAHAGDASPESLTEALQLLLVVCYFGGRAELWPPFHEAMRWLGDQAPASLVVLSAMHGDPARRGVDTLPLLEEELRRLPGLENPAEIIQLGVASVFADRIGDCRPALLRVVEDGRKGGAAAAAINAIVSLSVDAWKHGRWDEAARLVAEGQELAAGLGYLRYVWCFEGYVLNLINAARGVAAAEAAAGELDQWARSRGALVVRAMAFEIHCMAALSRGDFEAAYRAAAEISPAGVLRSHMPHALWVVFDLVEAATRTGRHDEARAHVEAARSARLEQLSSRLALAVRGAEALVAADDDRVRLFERALAVPGADQWPFLLARVRLCHGETLRRRRQVTEARRQLLAAQETFARLEAEPWSRRAESELRAAGVAGAEPRSALTAQEREIAQLAATGLTNKEIGERLALSPRTVAAHLYRVYPKLGITSRAALRDALSSRHEG